MLLLAAGRGLRFGGAGGPSKVFRECAGRTPIERSLARLGAVAAAAAVEDHEVVIARPADQALGPEGFPAELAARLRARGAAQIVAGGANRQQSMRRALDASDPTFELVLIHDAARPFLPVRATAQALGRALEVGAVCLAVPAPDTLKRVDDGGRIVETLDRTGVWLAQTPQIVRRELLLRALDAAAQDGFEATDDVGLLEHIGVPVAVAEGSRTNLKITTPQDLELAERLAAAEDGR